MTLKNIVSLFISLIVFAAVFILALPLVHYKIYEEPLLYKGHEGIQRYDRLKGQQQIYKDDRWISIDEWKRGIDSLPEVEPELVIPTTERPEWITPTLTPLDGQTKPNLVIHNPRNKTNNDKNSS